jgi:hypothetical protein
LKLKLISFLILIWVELLEDSGRGFFEPFETDGFDEQRKSWDL